MSTLSPPPLPPRTPSGAVVTPRLPASPETGRRLPPALPARPDASSKVVLVEDTRLVEAMSNEELGVLMRRFNKQVGHVHVAPTDPPRISSMPPLLDFQPSPDELFTPDKLRSNLERFYPTAIVGLIRFGKEIMRLRSWDEANRTAAFLAAYCLAWYFNVITATFLSFLSVLILVPSTRLFFFPPIVALPPGDPTDPPLAQPGIGLLPEFVTARSVGAERMASDFAEGMGALLVSTGTTTAEEGGEEKEGKGQKLAREAGAVAEDIDDLTNRDGPEISPEERKKKAKQAKKISKKERKAAKKEEKKEKMLDKHGRPIMLIVGDLADGWERWANAFSPTEPFTSSGRRSVVLSIFLPIIISTSGIFSEYVFSRVIGGFIGFLFFGQPILDRIAPFLEAKIPNWQEKMELRNGILAGVPTNAQLSLRLLRDAELQLKPLPPPPPPPAEDDDLDDEDGNSEDLDEFSIVDGGDDDTASMMSVESSATGKVERAERTKDKAKVQGKAKLASFIKSAAKLTEESAGYLSGQKQVDWEKMSKSALDKLHVSRDSGAAKGLLAVVPKTTYPEDTPSTFFLNHSGRPGHIIIHPPNLTTKVPARIVFTTVGNVNAADNYPIDPEAPVANQGKKGKLVISINDLIEVRKHGIGWQSRMFMSWAIGLEGMGGTGLELKVRRKKTVEVEVVASDAASVGTTETVTRQEEEIETFKFGAIVRRDELFNRLVALGDQRWEVL